MKILFTLMVLCFALNANAATYMLLSQTNAFAAGITNAAKAYAETQLTNKLSKAGDTSTTGAAFMLGSVVLTNNPTTTVPLQINATNGTTTNIFEANSGGTNYHKINSFGQWVVGVGTAAKPQIAPTAFPTYGFCFPSSDARMATYVVGGISTFRFGNGSFDVNDSITFGSIGSGDVVIRRNAAAELQLGEDSASPISQVIKSADGSGTDKDGSKFTMQGGQSTGTGSAGAVDLATGLTGETSASTANPYSIRYHAKGKFVALNHATTNAIIKFSLPANKLRGGSITALCYATNSTPHLQALTSEIQFAAVAVGTTITGTISQVDNPLAADSGTLTCAYTLVDNGDNTFYISANPNSSLSSPTERCKLVVTGMSGNSATTITDP